MALEKTHESPLDCKEIKPVNLKGNQFWIFIGRTDVEGETPLLWPHDAKNWLIGKDPDAGKDWRQEEKRMTEDEMVGWHHWLHGHEFEQALRVGDEQGSQACCSPLGGKESDTTERLNWTELISVKYTSGILQMKFKYHKLPYIRCTIQCFFSICTQFYNHHHHLIPERFYHHRNSVYFSCHPHFHFLPAPGNLLCRFSFWRKNILFFLSLLLLFSHSVVSNYFQPHGLQHSRLFVLHHLPGFAQTHVHWIGDATQTSHLLQSPSPPAFNLFQHHGLFQWVISHRWPKYSDFSFNISPSNEYSGLISFVMTCLISLQSKGLSRVFSNITALKQQLFGVQPSLQSNSHTHMWLLEKPQLWLDGPL